MSALAIPIARTLGSIAHDLATTRSRQKSLDAQIMHRDPTPEEEARWSQLDDRHDALVAEFCASFRAATGIDWQVAERAMS